MAKKLIFKKSPIDINESLFNKSKILISPSPKSLFKVRVDKK